MQKRLLLWGLGLVLLLGGIGVFPVLADETGESAGVAVLSMEGMT